MSETRNRQGRDSAKRLQLSGLAKRGIIAGYIHELSERHRGDDFQEAERAENELILEHQAEEALA